MWGLRFSQATRPMGARTEGAEEGRGGVARAADTAALMTTNCLATERLGRGANTTKKPPEPRVTAGCEGVWPCPLPEAPHRVAIIEQRFRPGISP